ncbi:MAG: histidine kinase [Rhodanobacteraceae bacterium]
MRRRSARDVPAGTAGSFRRFGICIAWLACLLLACFSGSVHAQSNPLPFELPQTVAFHATDNPAYALPDYDDANWKRMAWSTVAFSGGPVWLRWHLDVPAAVADSGKPVGLFLTAYASSEVWWDGQLLGRNGGVAATASAERPGNSRAVFFVPKRLLQAGPHVIALRLSVRRGSRRITTPVDAVRLDTYGSPLSADQTRYLPSLASVGALLLAVVILLAVRWRGGKPAAVWLAGACLFLLAQLATEASRAYVNYPYTWQGPRLALIALFAWLMGGSLFGFLLHYYDLRNRKSRLLVAAIVAVPALLPVVPGDMATMWILGVYLVSGLAASLAAVRTDRHEAWLSVVVLALLLAALLVRPETFLDRWLYPGFTLLLCVYFIDYTRTQARIGRALAQAKLTRTRLELELLKKHLRPHFLMNTLTALAEWLEQSPSKGAAMIEAVAEEFRMLDRVASRQLIPLSDELALAQTHMAVMGFRHDQTYELRCANPVGTARVPPAIFHTLAENALTHNRYESRCVTFSLEAEHLATRRWRYTFRCPPADNERTCNAEGTGSAYIKARLGEAYGKDWSFHAGPDADGGWVTVIEVPED